ncbi:MAG: metallophosphoesterase family protein [Ruminococcus sp.]
MKVVIISDTHGHAGNLKGVIEKVWPVDALIHCGDVEGEEDYIAEMAGCPLYVVAGNNDYFSTLEREMEFELGGKKIFLCHGHYYGVSMGAETIREEGESRKVDIVMYGHTHRPYLDIRKNITVLNPGSLAYPRQIPRDPSYMVMEIDSGGDAHFTVRYLKRDVEKPFKNFKKYVDF